MLKNTEKITGVFLELFKLKEEQGFYKLPPLGPTYNK